jgi:hypothetical protein
LSPNRGANNIRRGGSALFERSAIVSIPQTQSVHATVADPVSDELGEIVVSIDTDAVASIHHRNVFSAVQAAVKRALVGTSIKHFRITKPRPRDQDEDDDQPKPGKIWSGEPTTEER